MPDVRFGASFDGEEMTDRLAFVDLNVVMPTLMDNDAGDHFFGTVHLQALRKGKWKLVKGELSPKRWTGGDQVKWDFLRIDPKGRRGSIQLPDDECAGNGFTSLFDVSQTGRLLAAEDRDVSSSHAVLARTLGKALAELAAKKGLAENFELTPEQEQKLKSLGYLR